MRRVGSVAAHLLILIRFHGNHRAGSLWTVGGGGLTRRARDMRDCRPTATQCDGRSVGSLVGLLFRRAGRRQRRDPNLARIESARQRGPSAGDRPPVTVAVDSQLLQAVVFSRPTRKRSFRLQEVCHSDTNQGHIKRGLASYLQGLLATRRARHKLRSEPALHYGLHRTLYRREEHRTGSCGACFRDTLCPRTCPQNIFDAPEGTEADGFAARIGQGEEVQALVSAPPSMPFGKMATWEGDGGGILISCMAVVV